jgi:hypothetical protein
MIMHLGVGQTAVNGSLGGTWCTTRCTRSDPPLCADVGCISIKTLAARIRVLCAPAN